MVTMLKFSKRSLIALGGLVWFVVGLSLLIVGIQFILSAVVSPPNVGEGASIFLWLSRRIENPQNVVIIMLSLSLLIGLIKGRTVITKSAKRQVTRILGYTEARLPLSRLYSKGFYLLIGAMMGLGMTLPLLPISADTRGVIDTAVGAALINGALYYFRSAVNFKYLQQRG